MAEDKENEASPIQLTVATAERREVKMESPLFYILPPLVVAAVFIYCMVSTPDIPAASAAPAVEAKADEGIDLDDFTEDELNVDDEVEEADETPTEE